MMVSSEEIAFNVHPGEGGDIAEIILCRTNALNALSPAMVLSMYEQLRKWADATHIKAVVVRSSGGKAFCAGGDIRVLYREGREDLSGTMEFFRLEYRLNYLIHQYPKPYIAWMDGITMGGGVGISAHARYRLATERYLFAMPETAIGLIPDVGGSYILSRLSNHYGMYLGLTGARLNHLQAAAIGLVDYVFASDQWQDVLNGLIATAPKDSAWADRCLQPLVPHKQGEADLYQEWVARHFAAQGVEAILVSIQNDEKGKSLPIYQSCMELLQQASPTSLKITWEEITRGSQMDLAECLRQEFRLVFHLLKQADFYEGVRAKIIDKDFKPRWQPAVLSEVSDATVADYFGTDASLSDWTPA